MDTYDNLKQGEKGAWVSIIAYILVCIQNEHGLLYGLASITADGINNRRILSYRLLCWSDCV